MTNTMFDVLNVSFYGVYVVITFTCSNGAVCQNAYKFTSNAWVHVKGAKDWLNDNNIKQFYGAMYKMVQAGKAIKLDRKERSIRHDYFYYANGIGGNRRDCYFVKKVGLFA